MTATSTRTAPSSSGRWGVDSRPHRMLAVAVSVLVPSGTKGIPNVKFLLVVTDAYASESPSGQLVCELTDTATPADSVDRINCAVAECERSRSLSGSALQGDLRVVGHTEVDDADEQHQQKGYDECKLHQYRPVILSG